MGGISVLILMGLLSIAFFLIVIAVLIAIVYKMVAYVLNSIAIMCMCRHLGYKAPALAWIPFYDKYLLGKIAKSKMLGGLLMLLNIATICFWTYLYMQYEFQAIVFGIVLLPKVFSFILQMIILHKIYMSTISKRASIMTVFSVVSFGILTPIFLFVAKDKLKD